MVTFLGSILFWLHLYLISIGLFWSFSPSGCCGGGKLLGSLHQLLLVESKEMKKHQEINHQRIRLKIQYGQKKVSVSHIFQILELAMKGKYVMKGKWMSSEFHGRQLVPRGLLSLYRHTYKAARHPQYLQLKIQKYRNTNTEIQMYKCKSLNRILQFCIKICVKLPEVT